MEPRELRVSVALAALSAVVALSFSAVFVSDAYVGPLLGAALLPHLLGWLTRRWNRSPLTAALVSGGGLALYLLAFELGSPSRVANQLLNGWHATQRDVIPLPATLGTVLLLAVAVWAMASVADGLAFHLDGTVSALAPAMIVELWLRYFAPNSSWLASTVGFGVAAVAFLAFQHAALSERRRTVVGRAAGGRVWRVLPAVLIGALVATLAAAGVAAALDEFVHPALISSPNGSGSVAIHYQTSIAPLVNVGDQLQRGSEEQLFTVTATQPEYWRLTALDQYSGADGGQWTLDAQGSGAVTQGLAGPVPGGAVHQTYRIGPLDERWMPAAYEPVRVSRADTLVVRDSNTLVTGQARVAGLTYTVDSDVGPATVTAAQQAATAAPVPASLSRFTALPGGIPTLVLSTARRVTVGRTTPFAKAAALQAYFRSGQFVYDPSVDLGDEEDAMVRFLQTRRGFCVQFAATYAVMARSLGIPARVATGFTPGTPNGDGSYSVTNDDAHAWPEIWLAGLGWTDRFDPTPQTPQPGGSTVPGQPTATSTPSHQAAPVPATAAPAPGATGSGSRTSGATHQQNPTVSSGSPGSGGTGWRWLVVLVGVLVVAALAALLTVPVRKARRRARRRAAADPAAAVAGAWAETLDGFADAGVSWPASLTPLELSTELPERVGTGVGPPLGSLARRYTSVRYGARAPDSAQVDAAWRDAAAVRRALDATLGVGARLRARLRLRSAAGQPEPAGWSGWSRRRSSSTKV